MKKLKEQGFELVSMHDLDGVRGLWVRESPRGGIVLRSGKNGREHYLLLDVGDTITEDTIQSLRKQLGVLTAGMEQMIHEGLATHEEHEGKLLTFQMGTSSNNPEIDNFGAKRWRNEKGKLHRLDGPAIEYANGYKKWFVEGQLHRLDGPAIEYADGHKEWFVEGQRHRLDGPAVEYVNGDKYWYVEGKELTEEEFLALLNSEE